MKKNQNLFTRSVPPLLFVLIVPRSSQYDSSAEFTVSEAELLRAGLRDISAIRRALNDTKLQSHGMTVVDCGEVLHSQCSTATFPLGQV
jgi:hypothetical protein